MPANGVVNSYRVEDLTDLSRRSKNRP